MNFRFPRKWVSLSLGLCALVLFGRCISETNPDDRHRDSAGLPTPTFQSTVPDPRHYSFIAVGDTHIKGADTRRVKRILDGGTASGSLFFAILGDVVDRGEGSNYAPLSAFMDAEGWTGRVFAILGNHDVFANTWNDYKVLFGPSYYTFDVGNSRYIALDTADGTLGDGQWQWFENQLDQARPEHTFVFTHYMPVIPGDIPYLDNHYLKMPSDEEASRFMSLCSRKNVTAVLGGHYHGYLSKRIGNTQFVVAGGAGGRRMGDVQDFFYVEVVIDGSEVRYEKRTVE